MDKSSLSASLCAIIVSSSPALRVGLFVFAVSEFSNHTMSGTAPELKAAVSKIDSNTAGSESSVINGQKQHGLINVNSHKHRSDSVAKVQALETSSG